MGEKGVIIEIDTVLSIRTRGNLNNKFNGFLTHLVA